MAPRKKAPVDPSKQEPEPDILVPKVLVENLKLRKAAHARQLMFTGMVKEFNISSMLCASACAKAETLKGHIGTLSRANLQISQETEQLQEDNTSLEELKSVLESFCSERAERIKTLEEQLYREREVAKEMCEKLNIATNGAECPNNALVPWIPEEDNELDPLIPEEDNEADPLIPEDDNESVCSGIPTMCDDEFFAPQYKFCKTDEYMAEAESD